MKATICDICLQQLVGALESDKLRFNANGMIFEFGIFKIHNRNGIRRKQADICHKCYIEKLKEVSGKYCIKQKG